MFENPTVMREPGDESEWGVVKGSSTTGIKPRAQKKNRCTIEDVKKVVRKHLILEDEQLIDVILAAHIANFIGNDPLWLIVIGPPSSAKTETLRGLDGLDSTYFLSTLTPATLISGAKRKKGQPDPSLLPKLNGKTLILKDFTTVLSMRYEQRQEILAQLREVYDGQYSKDFGTGDSVKWKGKVGLIAACTPVYDRHYAVIGAMGDRFIVYRITNGETAPVGMAALRAVGNELKMRAEIQGAFHSFLNRIKTTDNKGCEISEETERKIVSLAVVASYGRCAVERDGYNRNVLYVPEPEGPARLVKQIAQLGTAIAMVNGQKTIDEYCLGILRKVARDLLPTQRRRVLTYLFDEKCFETNSEWRTTTQIAEAANMPTTTVKEVLEDLMTVGVLLRGRQDFSETAPYKWQIADIIQILIDHSGYFH